MVKPKITRKEDVYIIPCCGPPDLLVVHSCMGFHTKTSLSDLVKQIMNAVKIDRNRFGIEEIGIFYKPDVHNPEQPNYLIFTSVNKDGKKDGWTGAMDPTPYILKEIGVYEFQGYAVDFVEEKTFELKPEEMVAPVSDQVLATKYIDDLVAKRLNEKRQAQYMIRIIEF